jgi:hypothetical protein
MRNILAKAEIITAAFSDARGISPWGITDYKGVFTRGKGLGRAAFSSKVIALSRLYI